MTMERCAIEKKTLDQMIEAPPTQMIQLGLWTKTWKD